MRPFVKICGIVDPEDALICGDLGIDYIGVILHKNSPKFVEIALAKEIVQAAKETSLNVVGVFVEGNANEISHIAESIGLDLLQLHRASAKEHIAALSKKFPCIYAVSVEQDGSITNQEQQKLAAYGKHAQFLMYDHGQGGTGQSFSWENFTPPQQKNWILAGGLTPKNVRKAVDLLHPMGIDISSGVQKSGSLRKDKLLIQDLLKELE